MGRNHRQGSRPMATNHFTRLQESHSLCNFNCLGAAIGIHAGHINAGKECEP